MYMTPKEIREKFPNAEIGRGAVIESGAIIESGAWIGSGAIVESGAIVKSGAVIESGAIIESGAWIESGARIGVSRKGVTHTLVINGIGTTKQITAHTSEDGLVIVIGCLNSHKGATIEQARKAIADKYSADHAYFVALELAQRWYDQLKKEQLVAEITS